MEKIDDVLAEAKQMVQSFYSESEEEKAKIKKIKNNDELRESVASFVVNQMESVSNTDKLRMLLEAEIMRKAALHEFDNTDLKEMYRTISQQKTYHVDSLLKLFAPTQSVSPIITPATNDIENENTTLTSEERNAISKLSQIMARLNDKKNQEGN